TLAFRKPNLIRLELGKPRNEEFITDGQFWWVVSHNDKQVEKYEAANSSNAAAEASFLTFGFGQSSKKILEEYKMTLEGTRTQKPKKKDTPEVTWYRMKFVPREKDAPARFAAIELELPDDQFEAPELRWLPQLIVLHEADGEIVHSFRLRDMKVNPELEDKDFTYEVPRGYNVP
ncbi:unnamed protein product, partial [marine sediment metagenome]